jgi:hypothetical protein
MFSSFDASVSVVLAGDEDRITILFFFFSFFFFLFWGAVAVFLSS